MSQAAILDVEHDIAALHSRKIFLLRKFLNNYLYEFTESVVELLEIIKELKKLVNKSLGIKKI